MDTTTYSRFRQLHFQTTPLLLATIWDARSAAISQTQGFAAVGTSSAAIASMLGYPDGEQLPFAELRYLVGRICASTTLPVSVDLEGGYSRHPAQIAHHIQELTALGVVGINLEDSVLNAAGERQQLPAADFAATLRAVRAELANQPLSVCSSTPAPTPTCKATLSRSPTRCTAPSSTPRPAPTAFSCRASPTWPTSATFAKPRRCP